MAARRNWACGLAVGGWVEGSAELWTDPEERLGREVSTDKVHFG